MGLIWIQFIFLTFQYNAGNAKTDLQCFSVRRVIERSRNYRNRHHIFLFLSGLRLRSGLDIAKKDRMLLLGSILISII